MSRSIFATLASDPYSAIHMDRDELRRALAWNDPNGEWADDESMQLVTDDELRVMLLCMVIQSADSLVVTCQHNAELAGCTVRTIDPLHAECSACGQRWDYLVPRSFA